MVPSIAYARAHHLAKRAVERELAAQGRRAPFAEIIALAQAYRAAHQEELLAQAAEAVRTSPWHSMMADREVRELEREQRKKSDSAQTSTEIVDVLSTTSAIFRGSRLLIAR